MITFIISILIIYGVYRIFASSSKTSNKEEHSADLIEDRNKVCESNTNMIFDSSLGSEELGENMSFEERFITLLNRKNIPYNLERLDDGSVSIKLENYQLKNTNQLIGMGYIFNEEFGWYQSFILGFPKIEEHSKQLEVLSLLNEFNSINLYFKAYLTNEGNICVCPYVGGITAEVDIQFSLDLLVACIEVIENNWYSKIMKIAWS